MKEYIPKAQRGYRKNPSGKWSKQAKYRITQPWASDDELAMLRDFCRRDFWTFFLYGFGALANPKGDRWIDEKVHYPIARWFQLHVDEWFEGRAHGQIGEQKHLALLVPREVGKTTMISQAGQLWLHLRDPEISSYTGSERTELSMKILGGIKAVLDGSDPFAMFPKLYGNWSTGARTWTGKEIVHAARKNTSRKDPSFGTFAVETSIVGAHPDAWFHDDPNSYERMTTDSNWLATVNSQVSSMVPVIQSDGLVVWVGTRYDDDDHFGVAFRDEGVKSLSGMLTDSIATDDNGKWHVYFLAARDNEGVPTLPKVWPDRRLNDYQRRDPLRYAAQVMNDPAVSEFNPITREQIQQCGVESKDVPWHALSYGICCDFAFWDGKSRVRKDDTVMLVHGYHKNGSGDVYVTEVYGSPTWRVEDLLNRLVSTVQRYRRQGRRIIGISGDVAMAGLKGSWEANLRNAFHDVNEPMPTLYEFSRGGTRKTERMVSAAQFWVDGHVKWVKGSPGIQNLLDQMAKIGQFLVNPKLKNDYADAHADAFQPEFYQAMRRLPPQKAPYERDSTAIDVDGLDRRMFQDDEWTRWHQEVPREPIR